MATYNLNVQYNGGFLPGILLLTQVPIVVWFDGITIVYYYYLFSYYVLYFLLCLMAWHVVINVSV